MEPPSSLVGAPELPAEEDLASESFYIVRGGGPYGGSSLTYDLRRSGVLTVEHARSGGAGRGEIIGRETVQVPPDAAAQARRLLARVHPARLEGVEQDQRPVGCEPKGPHDVGEITIGFIRAGARRGGEDDEVGLFALPHPRSCDTPAAVEARKVVREILQVLPRTGVAAAFDRSTAERCLEPCSTTSPVTVTVWNRR